MPLFMDIHRMDEIDPVALAAGHEQDVQVGERYGVSYTDYWFSENPGTVFCLVEAPSAEAAESVHRETHGLLADEIIEVKPGT